MRRLLSTKETPNGQNGVYPTIQAILTSEQLPVWESDQHKDLAFFAILQKNRTPAAAAEANEVSTKALKAGLGEEGAESYQAGFKGSPFNVAQVIA